MDRYTPIIKGIDDKFSLLNEGIKVHSKINDVVTTDFTLSKLSEQEKEGMVELTSDARYAVRIIRALLKEQIQEWDYKKKCWTTRPLNKEERERIEDAAKHTFDSYMNRLMMINIVNRNRDDNPMLKYIFEIKEDSTIEEEKQQKSMADKLKSLVSKKEKEEQ